MSTLLQDIRYGLRMLLKKPGFTAVAVIALALGIGANSAIFSVVNTVLLRPLPFNEAERLVRVYVTDAKRGIRRYPTSYLNFADWREQNRVFEHLAAYSSASATLAGGDIPELAEGVGSSADLFSVLGAQPALGRVFTRDEERPGGSHVVVLSHGLWQRRFGSDPKIIGQQILFDGESTTVIGVMPPGFSFPLDQAQTEFWIPLDPKTQLNAERGANYLGVIGRLKPGASVQQAQAEMEAIARRLEQEYPQKNTGRSVNLVSMYEDVVGEIRPALLVLLGAVSFVLLIACANVANLLLARAASREKEMAIRTALGASRWRVMRQLLTESLLLSLLGGSLGLLLALWGIDLLSAAIPDNIPRVKEIGLDLRVLGFTMGVSILTGLMFGLAPALRASQTDLNESLKEGGRGSTEGLRRNRTRSLLVISEVALSLVLLIGAGLLIKSFAYLREIKPGFNPHNVLTASVSLPIVKYPEEQQQATFFQQTLERAAALPGVQSVAVVDPLPMSGNLAMTIFKIEGRPPLAPGEQLAANSRAISADYLRAMGIPLLKGRALTERDSKDAPKVMLINETLAQRFFPGEDPIGKRVTPTIAPDFTAEIVGIVGDAKHRSLDKEAGPEYYVSYLQAPSSYMSLVARTEVSDPTQLISALRGAVLQVDKDQPLSEIRTMEQLLANSVAKQRFNMFLLGIFAAVALLLAAVGIFGVMNYSVTRRTHEIGIRIALGAQSRDVLKLVMGQGMILTVIGVALGLAGAFAATRVMSSLLYGVSVTDPVTFTGVSLLLAGVALLACYLPARRATKVDPMIALRYE